MMGLVWGDKIGEVADKIGYFGWVVVTRLATAGCGMTRLATSQPLVASLNAHLGWSLNGVHKAE